MKKIHVPAIYVARDRVKANTREEKRLKRLLTKITANEFFLLPAADIYEKIKEEGWYERDRRTGQRKVENPNIIFSTFNWNQHYNSPYKLRKFEPLRPAEFRFADFRDDKRLHKMDIVCNSGFEIHTAFGCLHSCTYCHIGNALTVMLDIEDFMENLWFHMKHNQQQKLYKYDNQSDIPLLEPEYGAINDLVKFFAQTDRHLMLYTKSDNLDYLPNASVHQGHTIVCWTLSCNEVADKYELGAPSLDARLKAVEDCQEKHYRTRFRFSPIIPIKGWKEKNKAMIEEVFARTNPEVISLEMLCHMDKKQRNALFPDLEFGPKTFVSEYEHFPHENRSEVYRFFIETIREQEKKHNKPVKLALCLETKKMWDELSDLLRQQPHDFYCCCGERCA